MKFNLFTSSMSLRMIRLFLALGGGLLALLCLAPVPLTRAGGPWYVDPAGNDDNTCLAPGPSAACRTIQAAIDKADPGDIINIAAGVYTENLTISQTLTFVGAGADTTIVDGHSAGRVFSSTEDVALTDLTARNGNETACGGIYTTGALTLTRVNVLSNTGIGPGGARAYGAVTLIGGRFENNRNTYGEGGGLRTDGPLTMTDTQFINNTSWGSGGGVSVLGTARLTGGRFERNHAGVEGGGLIALGSLTVSGTQFIGNTAGWEGGGISARSPATLVGARFEANSGDWGGGLYAWSSLTLVDTDFVGNTTDEWGSGGGAGAEGKVTLTGGRFANNHAAERGGGLLARNTLDLNSAQFVGNTAGSGGGIYLENSSSASRLVNALLAANSAGTGNGLYLNAGGNRATLLHITIASPSVRTGAAVWVAGGTVAMTNTLITSHTVGINNAGGTATEDYSLFYTVAQTHSGTVGGGSHSLEGNPAFANPAGGDYHLSAASAAVDKGADAGVAVDFEGQARPQGSGYDIGYDEWTYGLGIDKAVNPTADVLYGGIVTYTIVLSNTGPLSDTHTLLTDTLPNSVHFAGWVGAPPDGAAVSDDQITWSGTLTNEAAITFTFQATHTAGPGETVTNTAQFSGTQQTGSADAAFTVGTSKILAVHVAGLGSGTISSSPAGIACGADCAEAYPSGTTVTLTATAAPTSTFAGWSGDLTGTDNPETITVDANKTVTATFAISADVRIEKTAQRSGTVLTFTVIVSNAGPGDVSGAVVSDTMPALYQAPPTWQCVSAGGATCAAGPHSGSIADTVNLPAWGVLTYTITGIVPLTGSVSNTAEVILPVGVSDPEMANNQASRVSYPSQLNWLPIILKSAAP